MSDIEQHSVLDELPGDLMIWVLIVSELLVFGAGLAAFMAVRITDPAMFAEAQDHLNRAAAGANTAILVTSGFLAAKALRLREAAQRAKARLMLVMAAVLGVAFLWIKTIEYRADAGGARLAGRMKMVAALERLIRVRDAARPLPGEFAAFGIAGGKTLTMLLGTHPPLEKRIQRLREMP